MFFSNCLRRRGSGSPDPSTRLINSDIESGTLSPEDQVRNLLDDLDAIGTDLLTHANKSVIRQLATLLPGAATNAAIYVGISLAFPQFKFAGLIAGNASALVHAVVPQLTGVDGSTGKGARFFSGLEVVLNTGALSEGVRGIGALISNPEASLIVSTVLPAIAQSALANRMTRDQQLTQLQKQSKALVNKIDKLRGKIDVQAFDAIVQGRLDTDGSANLYNAIKKTQ